MLDKPEMPKAYEPGEHEDKIYAAWLESGFFNPDNLPGERKESFSMVLPPPNVTGVLHLGHAAMLAIEDAMTRFARMNGKRALWVPGTDHAAIATQTKVEKLLIKDGIEDPRRTLGREEFLNRVKKFASESHDTIVHQVKKMGASLDWSREAYTLDEDRNKAVNTVFKMMYDDGLIYRGHRVINWCPRCKSTLADDEVQHKETVAKFYAFKYDKNFPISISTTRPETKLGDTAVAVHPTDERYQKFIGQIFEADFCGQKLKIKIIADEAVDPAFGTGALGVTPAHSQIDADMAYKNELSFIQVIGEDGLMTAEAGSFVGLSVLEAREKIIESLRNSGLIEKEEEVPQNLSVCYRCETPVEPLPKLQWFIGVNRPFKFHASVHAPIEGIVEGQEVTLKQLMQHVVRTNQIKIMPEQFVNTYFHWIDNLRDWNISRQIWFGHQVPVWYEPPPLTPPPGWEGKIFVGLESPGEGWIRDEDTLDTWFSSGLWTFSTLGWPDKTKDFEMYHPNTIMETGYDILFFWVARMILMTTYAIGEVPFKNVYLHGLVRDEHGKKMSKSLGNAIDPLLAIEKYGADATRLSLVIGTSPGNDMKMSEEKIAGFRNFTNKLWNIARFSLMNIDKVDIDAKPNIKSDYDQSIIDKLENLKCRVTNALENYQFSFAGEELRDFTWSEFADKYLEVTKIEKDKSQNLNYILNTILKLWHPFMPFVTEKIWQEMYGEKNFLMVESWPLARQFEDHTEAMRNTDIIDDLVNKVLSRRGDLKIEPKTLVNATVFVYENETAKLLERNKKNILVRSRMEDFQITSQQDSTFGTTMVPFNGGSVHVSFSMSEEDRNKEKDRLTKELENVEKYLVTLEKQLSNEEFVAKAPAKVIEGLKQKQDEANKKSTGLKQQLENL
jgi:valyl-tRNA synthetase